MGKENIWITSDWHFGHANIQKFEGFEFPTIGDRDELIIKNLNKVVGKDDQLFMLGDVSFYSNQTTKDLLSKIKCQHKVLIMGNHDKTRSINKWIELGFEYVSPWPIIIDFFILSHENLYLNANTVFANIHGHIHQILLQSKHHINACVIANDFKPLNFSEIKKRFDPNQWNDELDISMM